MTPGQAKLNRFAKLVDSIETDLSIPDVTTSDRLIYDPILGQQVVDYFIKNGWDARIVAVPHCNHKAHHLTVAFPQ